MEHLYSTGCSFRSLALTLPHLARVFPLVCLATALAVFSVSGKVEPLRRSLLSPRLCCVRLVGFSMEFLFDGLEIEERELSVWRNGRLSGYIYSLGEAQLSTINVWPNGFSSVWTHILFCFSFRRSQTQHSIWRINFRLSVQISVHYMNSEPLDPQSMKKYKSE